MIVPVFILLWTTLLPLSVNCDAKCCNSDEQLIYSNSTDGQFVCAEKSEKRLDFFANSTSFLKTNRNGICYDILNSTFYVQLDNRDGQLKSALYALKKSDDFRKCCPINFVYNTRTHGCVQNISYLPEINVGLVSIGLPECRIIRDVVFNAAEEQTREASNAKEQHCTDGTDDGRFVLRICESSTDICKLGKCVRKCCPDGQSFVMGRHCRDTFEHGLNMSFSSRIIRPEDPFSTVHRDDCNSIYILKESKYDFNLTENGMLDYHFLKKPEGRKLFNFDDKLSYCIEHVESEKVKGFNFFMCHMEFPSNDKFEFTKWPKILTCIGLLFTIIVYLILNKANNLFGKSLICYCLANLATFVLLLSVHFDSSEKVIKNNKAFCVTFAYFLMFFIFSQFLWLNVLCWDIWNTFGFAKTAIMSQSRRAKWKKFGCYNLYAWGIAVVLTLIVYIFNTLEVLPYEIHPFVGISQCFLERRIDNYSRPLFKDIPLLLIEIANVFLFVKTVRYCLKVKNEISTMNDNSNNERSQFQSAAKEKLLLIFKLSVIMGVFLLFEVVSGFTDMSKNPITKYIEIVWDTINNLQGVFIFIIFVCKKVIYSELLFKCGIGIERKISTTSMTNC